MAKISFTEVFCGHVHHSLRPSKFVIHDTVAATLLHELSATRHSKLKKCQIALK